MADGDPWHWGGHNIKYWWQEVEDNEFEVLQTRQQESQEEWIDLGRR